MNVCQILVEDLRCLKAIVFEYHHDEEDNSDNSSAKDEDDENCGESDIAGFLHNRDGSDKSASSAKE